MNYIYLDTKITGAARQLISYFQNHIFDYEKTIVYYKIYKKHTGDFSQLFKTAGIQAIGFNHPSQIRMTNGGVVFYLFNAQSNCRIVANRNLTHIFVTHGESNKISSVKPIIRIYDYVVTAGEAGKQRYLENHIFTPYDIDHGKIIAMGDTFIGKTGLSIPSPDTQEVIFYAPTWEGGVPSEDYSSLSYTNLVAQTITQLAEKLRNNTIIIKPHPNTGHRLKSYRHYLLNLLSQLKQNKLRPILYTNGLSLTFIEKIRLRKQGIKFVSSINNFTALYGLCDISAMETQFLNENIPYILFYPVGYPLGAIYHQNNEIYGKNTIRLDEGNPVITIQTASSFYNLKNHIISQELVDCPINQRINYLIRQTQHP
ncbi:CDP-glycerol glycerophosphotransferase family protein [Neisseria perflava]|uniref:CDP-glycerol glycerophosphotransferase family protein n=1 Tax=Neisseria perflava TaxID=33053 RepID=UPI0020A07C63|nr:CDP-glycerol glycerophosphotransferase family protein [Neisseria perflava]MCP1660529.1 hypothetical protein [Neisseria perflava]MCP1772826.1 hypothetical protein [Neisseria perflava]